MKHSSLAYLAMLLANFAANATAAAFVPSASTPSLSLTSLFGYLSDWGGGGGSNQDSASPRRRARRSSSQSIPLLGPIPGAPPLLVGGEMTLDPPTPLQWQTLEEALMMHQAHLLEITADDTTGVEAAPLVAVIDDVTGKGPSGRYATLAAVVGMSPSSRQHSPSLDMSDETSFMESLSQISGAKSPHKSCIRLVGVGRATLNDFFHKLPTRNIQKAADEREMSQEEEDTELDDDEVVIEEQMTTPIVMAEFTILTDSSAVSYRYATPGRIGEKGARSMHRSPVHAIAEMSKLLNRVIYLHEERRRLVSGLKAAKARLEQVHVFEDHDGIGQVTYVKEGNDDDTDKEVMEEFLTKYTHDLLPSSLDTSVLSSMDNYGLNYYSAFASIPQLSNVALETFKPYYSPERRDTEEHEMEIASFVAFRALDGFCTAHEIAWALQCTNTVERLNAAYNIMFRHKLLLQKAAGYASQDLRDCGEECTDLW